MPQETPNVIPLPEKVQEAINLATARVDVLREEELRLSRLRVEIERGVARLQITKDTLEAAIPKLEQEAQVASANTQSAEEGLERLQGQISASQDELRTLSKAAQEAKDLRIEEDAKLSEAVSSARGALIEVEKERAKLEEQVTAFNKRKADVQALLSTI